MSRNVAPVITSHSRLLTLEKCSELHYREYVLKARAPRVDADYFMLGTACHKSIEAYYPHPTANHPIELLDPYWHEWLRERNLGFLMGDLKGYREDIADLYFRASAECTDPRRWIRKGDKSVADHPQMTSAWKQAVEKLGLDDRAKDIDRKLRTIDPVVYGNVSLCNAYSESHEILKGYKDPEMLSSIEHIEFPISHRVFEADEEGRNQFVEVINPVRFPSTQKLFNGYIDLVGGVREDMGGGIALIDHKTSSGAAPSMIEVMYHEQLNLYAWAWNDLQLRVNGKDQWDKTWLGVNHLRSSRCVMAKANKDIAMAVVARREALIELEMGGFHVKRDPFSYNSPCLKMRDGRVSEHCPHLEACHPGVARDLGVTQGPLQAGFN